MTISDSTEVVLVVDRGDLAAAQQAATELNIQLKILPVRGLEPLTTVTIILIGAAAAVGVVVDVIDKNKGGQVIDLRPGAPKSIYRSKDVVYGLVLVIAQDGVAKVQVLEPRGMFGTAIEALKNLAVEMSGASAQQIAESAKGALGEVVDVTVDALPSLELPNG